ncbi:MAG: TIGR03663 family protein [Sedimentisphaerales bacterium]|nr:TIGR03663 family protein [Sedimentisphaerales bacterium]
MSSAKKCCVLILVATFVAVLFRVPRLDKRPMHTDEAVHADKYRLLLEGQYRYDPHEYHGPTLNYMTLIPALLSGAGFSYAHINEYTLRIVPVFFGIMLVLLLLLIKDAIGPRVTVYAAILTAVSPVLVFYSRYYIQEMLLVAFTFGFIISGYHYFLDTKVRWAMPAGLFAGLMFATKETSVIAFGSIGLAGLCVLLLRRGRGEPTEHLFSGKVAGHIVLALAVAVLVSVLFYSSFFANPQGILDSVRTFETYFNRAGENPVHIHPWFYYLKQLVFYQFADGPIFTEIFILILALAGTGFVVTGHVGQASRDLLRFVAIYAWTMMLLYSAIPYKTPWCLLGFYHGLILLAGVGAAGILGMVSGKTCWMVKGIFLVGVIHLGWQSLLGGVGLDIPGYISKVITEGPGKVSDDWKDAYIADSRNPWVYAHTSRNIFAIADWAENIALAHPDKYAMHIQVIIPEKDYWPLPWYLRKFTRVGYWTMVHKEVASAPLIIAKHPEIDAALMHKLYELPPPGQRQAYLILFDVELRPQLQLRGYVSNEAYNLWYHSDTREVDQLMNQAQTEKKPVSEKPK